MGKLEIPSNGWLCVISSSIFIDERLPSYKIVEGGPKIAVTSSFIAANISDSLGKV